MAGMSLIAVEPGRQIYSERVAASRYARGAETVIPVRPLETVIDVTPVQEPSWGRGKLRDNGFAAQAMAQQATAGEAPAVPPATLGVQPYQAALARHTLPDALQLSLVI
jgi:hypothetical protein